MCDFFCDKEEMIKNPEIFLSLESLLHGFELYAISKP
jgi:hypothetical protein